MIKLLVFLVFFYTFSYSQYYYSFDKKIQLQKISSKISRTADEIEYKKNNFTVWVNKKLIVKFKDNISNSTKEKILKKYHLKQESNITNSLWVISTTNPQKTIDISNALHNLKEIIFAHPDFKKTIHKRDFTILPKDRLFNKQLYLQKHDNDPTNHALNIIEISKITRGSGVKVGMIDDGLDIVHEDLAGNIYGYNVPSANQLQLLSTEVHGTKMAGIIIAKANKIGILGIANQAKLYFAKHDNERNNKINISQIISNFKWLREKKVKVISNSWGTYDVEEALSNYISILNKEGIIIVFAAGNENIDLDDPKYNDESELDDVIGVSSVQQNGEVLPWFANYGSKIDVFTIGEDIASTSPNNRYSISSGTSPSAAIASGAISLFTSLQPSLNKDDVIKLLKKSSKDFVQISNTKYPILNPLSTINNILENQSIEDIENQLFGVKTIIGKFINYDFKDTPNELDWVLKKGGFYYALFAKAQDNENTMGFMPINIDEKKLNLNNTFLLINRFNVDSPASKYWVITNIKLNLTYLVHIEKEKLSYTKLNLDVSLKNTTRVFFTKKNTM